MAVRSPGAVRRLPGEPTAESAANGIGHITLGVKRAGKRSAGKPPAPFDVAGVGDVTMGAGLRPTAKGVDEPPDPTRAPHSPRPYRRGEGLNSISPPYPDPALAGPRDTRRRPSPNPHGPAAPPPSSDRAIPGRARRYSATRVRNVSRFPASTASRASRRSETSAARRWSRTVRVAPWSPSRDVIFMGMIHDRLGSRGATTRSVISSIRSPPARRRPVDASGLERIGPIRLPVSAARPPPGAPEQEAALQCLTC